MGESSGAGAGTTGTERRETERSRAVGTETIVQLFEREAARAPEAVAVVEAGMSLTYGELDRQANRLARYIRQATGALRGQIVSILMEPSLDFMVSVWGVLKAGHAFLAIDPELPEQRQSFMLNDAGSPLLLSKKKHLRLLNRLQWECPRLVRFLCLDSHDVLREPETDGNPLMDKQLWDLVGHKAEDPIGRGGWQNSFTGELFSEEEIAECRENVLQKLKPYLHPSARVLEVGCSSGITMFHLAPHVGLYLGTDLSDVILAETERQAAREGYANIRLTAMPAHQIDRLEERDFDVVILNSVVQAFHGHNYLRQVLAKAVALMKPTAVLFLGDVMNQDAKPALAAALAARRQAQPGAPIANTDLTNELFLSPGFLADLVHEQPGLKSCRITEKLGALRNELTDYRFDALLEIDKSLPAPDPAAKARKQEGLDELEKHSDESLSARAGPDDLAYVIYTSGSTGRPKGVLVEHRALANLARWYVDFNAVTPADRVAKFASCGFDASIMETLPPLTAGASIYVLGREERLDLQQLNRFLEANRITLCFLPTQYAEQFMAMANASLRRLHTGGEKLRRYTQCPYSVVDHYGPAECTVVSSVFVVDAPAREIPIGQPIPGSRIYVLDEQQRPVPDGDVGELYVSGVNVARGYLNLPELTSQRFLPDPWRPGARMYRTGDLGRRLPDGNLLFVGRVDHQVKVRGCRVELGEIESVLREHPAVRDCVVTAASADASGPDLTAYVVANGEARVEELRAHLRARLPEYTRPDAICLLDALPLNASGKVDRSALPKPSLPHAVAAEEADGTPVELGLRRIWKEVLRVPAIGLSDDFFDLGGNSLKVLKALAEINRTFQVELSATELFKARTIPAQAALIAGAERRQFAPIEPAPKRETYPASAAQKRLFFIQELDAGGTAYNIPFAFSIRGELDTDRLARAFDALLAKYEILRTDFHVVAHTVVQRIRDRLDFQLEVVEESQDGWGAEALVPRFVRPFALGQAPLIRARVVGTGPAAAVLLIDLHHILLDGTSAEVLWRDLADAYNGEPLGAAAFQYKDFSEWLGSPPVRAQLAQQEAYWFAQFAEAVPVLKLPLDFERPSLQSFAGAKHRFVIGEPTVARMRQVCERHGLSLNMLLLAAYSILLAKYGGQDDLVVGTPVYGRRHADMRDAVGLFVNTLALRFRPRPDRTVADYLAEVRQVLLQGLEHQDYPFEELVGRLELPRDLSRNPLFDTMFVTQGFDLGSLSLRGLRVEPLETGWTPARFDLTWFATLEGDAIGVQVEYCTTLFAEPTVRAMSEHFTVLLDAVCGDPSRELRELSLLGDRERRYLLEELNRTADFPELERTVIELFEAVVAERAEETALVFGSEAWSYARLDAAAERIGAQLRSQGCGPGAIVGVLAERSPEMIAGMLGVLKSGAAILPLNPAFPADYLERIVEDSGARVVLEHLPFTPRRRDSDASKARALPPNPTSSGGHAGWAGAEAPAREGQGASQRFLSLELAALIAAPPPATAASGNRAKPTDTLYVVYTSGTTGKPKGIAVDHRTLVNLIEHQRRFTSIDCSGVLQFAAPTFDVSFQEVFSCLLAGGGLLLVPEAERTDLPRLFARLEARQIRTVFLPPALLQLIFGEPEYAAAFPACVRHIVAAGEQLVVPERLRELIRQGRVALHNHYGPSETHVVTTHTLDRAALAVERPPIGRPIANRPVYVLDESGQLLPPGVAGELCVGGRLTRPCYRNDPEGSQRRFPADPFAAGGRIYRTGDLARWNRDGTLEFLGRIDAQVKIRGHRIEPSAIEAVLGRYSGMRSARVIAVGDGSSRQLCAYYVADRELRGEELRAYLGRQLPEYMVPSFFVAVDVLPVTANGKLDVAALPSPFDLPREPAAVRDGGEDLTEPQRRLRRIWQEVLGVAKVGLDEDFFALGGHSLKVLVTVAEIRRAFQVELSPAALFRARTLRAQSALVAAGPKARQAPIAPAPPKPFYPASPAQKRLFLLQQLALDSTAYNMPYAFSVEGALDSARLGAALEKVVARHEVLRTGFELVEDEVVQRIHAPSPFAVETVEDERDLPELMRDFVRPFDLSRAPLLRVRIVRRREQASLLLVDVHHILMDGTSTELFWRELSQAYDGRELGAVPLQYKDFSEWQRSPEVRSSLKAQEEYWLAQYRGGVPALSLPLDFPRGEYQSFAGRTLRFVLDAALTCRLRAACERHDISLNMLLLAAWSITLAKQSGGEDLVVGMPVYARNHANAKDAMGMFANTLALHLRPRGELTVEAYLAEVRDVVLRALENQDYPFEELVERIELPRDASRNPLFDSLFVTQSFPARALSFEGLRVEPLEGEATTAKFDLSCFAAPEGEQVRLVVEYCSDLFREATVRDLAAHFERLLGALSESPAACIANLEGSTAVSPVATEPTLAVVRSPRAEPAPDTPRPGEETVPKLLAFWREVLGVEDVDAETDFFAAGGHSLKAIGLMLRIKKAFGVDLPNSVIFRYPTVSAMAQLLAGGADGYRFSHLVQLSKDRGPRRLFCIHPAPGSVVCYRPLAELLPPEWSVFGLQAKGLIRGQAPHATVEEMAADYVREIVREQPRGPYFLLGWSVGGKIAYEVARQLEAFGERVSLLAMVDTDPVFLPKARAQFPRLRLFGFGLWMLLTQGGTVRKNWHVLDIASFWPPDLWRRLRMWVELVRAVARYRPPRHAVAAKVVLFQTAGCARREERLDDKALSVGSVVRDLEIVPVAGHHLDLFSAPNVEPLCAELAKRLGDGGEAMRQPDDAPRRAVAGA